MLNSLSAELNILRPSLLETSLEVIARNLNHRNNNLKFFEFGKGYFTTGEGQYHELEQLCLVVSGNSNEESWKQKSTAADFYYLKGALNSVFTLLGVKTDTVEAFEVPKLNEHIICKINGQIIAGAGEVKKSVLSQFGIKQPVFFAAFDWAAITKLAAQQPAAIKDLPRFPAVMRDISMENTVHKLRLDKLQEVKLFDIFESEKLGAGKKSMAVSFTFLDEEKTLTDKEIDDWMNKIMVSLEKELNAEIRK
jgi:phenylalanyl-tRNA synthetase beta chain